MALIQKKKKKDDSIIKWNPKRQWSRTIISIGRTNKKKWKEKPNRKQTNDIHIDAHAHFIRSNGSCGQIIHDTFDVPTIEKQKKIRRGLDETYHI